MTEIEMEKYLIANKYDVFSEEGFIDSCLVIDAAVSLGYVTNLPDNEEYVKFESIIMQ